MHEIDARVGGLPWYVRHGSVAGAVSLRSGKRTGRAMGRRAELERLSGLLDDVEWSGGTAVRGRYSGHPVVLRIDDTDAGYDFVAEIAVSGMGAGFVLGQGGGAYPPVATGDAEFDRRHRLEGVPRDLVHALFDDASLRQQLAAAPVVLMKLEGGVMSTKMFELDVEHMRLLLAALLAVAARLPGAVRSEELARGAPLQHHPEVLDYAERRRNRRKLMLPVLLALTVGLVLLVVLAVVVISVGALSFEL